MILFYCLNGNREAAEKAIAEGMKVRSIGHFQPQFVEKKAELVVIGDSQNADLVESAYKAAGIAVKLQIPNQKPKAKPKKAAAKKKPARKKKK